MFFVFGSWISFLLRNYPYNMSGLRLRQYYVWTFFGEKIPRDDRAVDDSMGGVGRSA